MLVTLMGTPALPVVDIESIHLLPVRPVDPATLTLATAVGDIQVGAIPLLVLPTRVPSALTVRLWIRSSRLVFVGLAGTSYLHP